MDSRRSHAVCSAPSNTSSCSASHGSSSITTMAGSVGSAAASVRKASGQLPGPASGTSSRSRGSAEAFSSPTNEATDSTAEAPLVAVK